MWGKIVHPAGYTSFGLRENTYLVAALLLLGVVVTYWTKTTLAPFMATRYRTILVAAESLAFAVMVPLVLVFLRPINQFIYFQF